MTTHRSRNPASRPIQRDAPLTSRGYHITVDGGRDSFYALCIEDTTSEAAWIMSDTAYELSNER